MVTWPCGLRGTLSRSPPEDGHAHRTPGCELPEIYVVSPLGGVEDGRGGGPICHGHARDLQVAEYGSTALRIDHSNYDYLDQEVALSLPGGIRVRSHRQRLRHPLRAARREALYPARRLVRPPVRTLSAQPGGLYDGLRRCGCAVVTGRSGLEKRRCIALHRRFSFAAEFFAQPEEEVTFR